MRLIDADALKNSIDEHVYLVHHGFNETEYGCTQYGIHQIIDDAPTVDAVPVIRCANCKYYSTETEQTAVPNMHKCTWWRNIGVFPIDFCSRAEPKNAND